MGNGKWEIGNPWNFGTLELWNFGTLELWNIGTMELWNPETIGLSLLCL